MENKTKILIVSALALMLTIMPLFSLNSATAQTSTSSGPYPGKTQYPWPQFLHDENHTGVSSGPGPKTNHLLWKFVTPESVRTSPSIVDGMVFVGETGGQIYALDVDTGEVIWSFKTGSMAYNSMTVYEGILYVTATGPIPQNPGEPNINEAFVVAFNEWNGDLVWKYNYEAGRTTWWGVQPSGFNLYTAGFDTNQVFCIAAHFGVNPGGYLVWKANLTEYSGESAIYGIASMVTVFDGKVYAGSYVPDGNFYCLDELSGEILWAKDFGGVARTVTVSNNRLYVPVAYPPGDIYCLDPNTGDTIWKFTEESIHASVGLVVYNDKVYGGSNDQYFYCLNATTGTVIWKYQSDKAFTPGSPAAAEGMIYTGALDNNLYCFDEENGDVIWKYDVGDEIQSSPAIADGKLVVGSGSIYANEGGVWCFGKGPTDTSLSVTSSSAKLGDSIVVSGSVLDQSPYTLQRPDEQSLYVANGPVTLSYSKDGGATTELTTVTTDSMGRFSYEWTPTAEGTYDLYASFAGDDSYEPSMESIKVQVGPAPADVPTADEVAQEVLDQLPAYTTMDIVIIVAVVVAICISLYSVWTVRKLRK